MNSIWQKAFFPIARNMATKAAIVSPCADRFYFFNFFEKPELSEKDFFNAWLIPGHYVKKKPEYVSMHLHNDKKYNCKYPWVNFVVTNSQDSILFGKEDPEWVKLIQAGFKHGFRNLPAGYREISSMKGNALDGGSKVRSKETRFIMVPFTVDESKLSLEKFEDKWTEYSGMNAIENEESIADAMLYKRFQFRIPGAFQYVVRAEINNLDENGCQKMLRKVKEGCDEAAVDGVTNFPGLYSIHVNM